MAPGDGDSGSWEAQSQGSVLAGLCTVHPEHQGLLGGPALALETRASGLMCPRALSTEARGDASSYGWKGTWGGGSLGRGSGAIRHVGISPWHLWTANPELEAPTSTWTDHMDHRPSWGSEPVSTSPTSARGLPPHRGGALAGSRAPEPLDHKGWAKCQPSGYGGET